MKKISFALLIVGILIISGCVDENQKIKSTYTSDEENTSYTEMSSKDVHVTTIERVDTLQNLKHNTNFHFEPGEIYVYKVTDNFAGTTYLESGSTNINCEQVDLEIPIFIDDIERTNKTDYYIAHSKKFEVFPTCYRIGKDGKVEKFFFGKSDDPSYPDNPLSYGGCKLGFTNNGTTSDLGFNQPNSMCLEFGALLPEIALYLDETTKIIKKSKSKMEVRGNSFECGTNMEIEVVGLETINNKECFKVEVISTGNCSFTLINNEMKQEQRKSKDIYCIDKQKRIAVKFDRYEFVQGGYFHLTSIKLKEIRKNTI